MSERIAHPGLRAKVMSAHDAAAKIAPGDQIGFSGFTGAGYPKEVPTALAERIKEAHQQGREFRVNVLTGASTAPELDGVLAETGGVNWRMPYQSDPRLRDKINDGTTFYSDIHLSHSGMMTSQGFFGPVDAAVVEAVKINADGSIVPSSSVGNSVNYLDAAEKIIIEVNEWQSLGLEGMHDIWRVGLPPHRQPIPITTPGQRIGSASINIDVNKVVAVVRTNAPDRNSPFKSIDQTSKDIAGHLLEFARHEITQGRFTSELRPLQSGVGNIANAVLAGLLESEFENLTSYTEVIQDGMVDLLDSGKMALASATSFALSPEAAERMNNDAERYAKKLTLRPQEVSNHPEIIRRLGVIATNGMIEADIYGNVNSTHIMGSRMMNGLGGSGDFTRNAYISIFVSPSIAKNGDISAIVPMVSHHDHTEHDVQVIITEQGLADLRGLAPRQRARVIIDKCAHPSFRPMLTEYLERAEALGVGMHTPHDLAQAHSWHRRFLDTGSMRP
ncbi:acetyl-CoA hydrolase/transferase family protein [Corynebacterium heidelbergense]|uniref:Propionyl-CoA--succinate CoA transferase n=1 Tax=Corynebacterium heidelbergense TaxID=2055947 RepID=A0A364V9R0_9CORY|nr:acetyl-CoA hydrolase/transferase family protein [Corynebacterium heidelbergense]RAV33375.1 propionyl-CoA--succinate CoA transferase [Corynebacterium heidelbergense]WCZ35967.1 Succinyl-CoA:coenzyme A transferase [Corynebacterium heidelbergense]